MSSYGSCAETTPSHRSRRSTSEIEIRRQNRREEFSLNFELGFLLQALGTNSVKSEARSRATGAAARSNNAGHRSKLLTEEKTGNRERESNRSTAAPEAEKKGKSV